MSLSNSETSSQDTTPLIKQNKSIEAHDWTSINLYKPSVLSDYLRKHQVHPKKQYSQNFLIDGNILAKIIDSSKISSGDFVLEIGAGPGALTEKLLEKGCRVVAVEKDPSFASLLKKWQHPHLKVIETNALELTPDDLPNDRPVHIVANLPYNITSPIITKFLEGYPMIHSLNIMVQKEVAERICAQAKSKAFGRLSVFCDFHSERSLLFTISPNSFYPVPKVHSAFVRLVPKKNSYPLTKELFAFVKQCFQGRRKTLRHHLKKILSSSVFTAIEKNNSLLLNQRVDQLDLDEYQFLVDSIYEKNPQELFFSSLSAPSRKEKH